MEIVKSKRVSELSEIAKGLSRALTLAYVSANQLMPETLNIIVNILEKDIRENFPMLTMDEVSHAINKGIRGEYTERTDISNANIYQWLKAWKNSEERMNAIANRNTLALPERGTLTEAEKKQSSVSHVLMLFDHYKNTHEVTDYGNAAYLFLEKEGIINYTPERKREIFEQAKVSLSEQIKLRRFSTMSDRRRLKAMADVVLDGGMKPEVIIEARRLALKIFFDNLIEMEEDLSFLLTT